MVQPERLPTPEVQSGYLELAPDLVVKIVSPSDRWTTVSEKVDSYLATGITLVRVVEPKARAVRVYTSEGAERRLRADHDDVLGGRANAAGLRTVIYKAVRSRVSRRHQFVQGQGVGFVGILQ